MNLIEKLGGYEETKKHLDSCWCDDDNKAYLLEKLLEYRRQHNIFEVGDWFVSDAVARPYKILERTETDLKIWNQEFTVEFTGNKDTVSKMFFNARHATNEEIKAGRRL